MQARWMKRRNAEGTEERFYPITHADAVVDLDVKIQEAVDSSSEALTSHIENADIHFSAHERDKLNTIEEGANKTIVDSALSSTSTNPVENKAVQTAIQTLEDSKANKDEVGVLYVNITMNTSSTGTSDKSSSEILEAHNNGQIVMAKVNGNYPAIPFFAGDEDDGVMFSLTASDDAQIMHVVVIGIMGNDATMYGETVDAEFIGALPADTFIPSKTSDLTNDSNFVTTSVVTTLNDEFDDHVADTTAHMTSAQKNQLTTAYNHSQAAHVQVSDSVTSTSTVTAATSNSVKKAYDLATTANTNANNAKSAVTTHNIATDAHNDIRLLISALTTQLNNFLNVNDTTKDQLSEIIALIEANATDIDTITSGKVNVSDIINNLTTNVTNKPLSAAQGVTLKALIDDLQDALDTDEAALATHVGNSTIHITATERSNWNDAVSKEHTHSNKTILDNTTASYTTAEQIKLSGIATGAEVNQNAFSNVKVGSTTVAADSKTDTIEFVGSNVTITPDATNDKITFTVANGTTSAKGIVQLTNSTSSTSTTTAATPSSVKSAYDLANTAKTAAATAQSTADSKAPIEHEHDASDITSGTISTSRLPQASGTQAGVTIVYPAASCTTFSSDSGTVTPLAVQKGAKMFAIPRVTSTDNAITRFDGTTGDVQDSKIIIEDVTNTRDTSKTAQVISIPAEGGKKMVYGYCTDQVDGTSFIGGVFDADATSYPYNQGLAISGTSGNLLWKGNRVAVISDIPSTYAGSSIAGGSATSAVKLDTSTAGSETQPVYFSGGKPVATTYTLGKSVPSDAKFTDTTYTLGSFGITATSTELNVLDGITATTAELNYVDGATSNIQTQLNAKAASSDLANYLPLTGGTVSGTLTANKIVASSFTANCNANVQNLEFFPGTSASHGGYIDFHYNSSSSDYTSRIMETASGTLTATTHLKVRNDTSYTTAKCRNIYANTKAMTANSSSLANGTIYLQYT